jgi:hypothetical protein
MIGSGLHCGCQQRRVVLPQNQPTQRTWACVIYVVLLAYMKLLYLRLAWGLSLQTGFEFDVHAPYDSRMHAI